MNLTSCLLLISLLHLRACKRGTHSFFKAVFACRSLYFRLFASFALPVKLSRKWRVWTFQWCGSETGRGRFPFGSVCFRHTVCEFRNLRLPRRSGLGLIPFELWSGSVAATTHLEQIALISLVKMDKMHFSVLFSLHGTVWQNVPSPCLSFVHSQFY